MRRPPKPSGGPPLRLSREQVLTIGIWLEVGVLLLAALWARLARLDLRDVLEFPPSTWMWALVGVSVMVGGNTLLLLGERYLGWQQPRLWLEELFVPLFKDFHWWDLLLLSAAAGFCEEVFFRGVMQTAWGWGWASLLFGLVHLPGQKHWGLGVWAVIMGGWLGLVYQQSGSLWAPIISHGLYDLAALVYIRYVECPRRLEEAMRAEDKENDGC